MGDYTLEFTKDNFESDVLGSGQPVLVDFWAEWCGPCRVLGPTVEEVAKDYSSTVKVGKLNVDQHPEIATRYGIRSIPTLLIFKDGRVQEQIVGAVPRQQITALLDKYINS